MHRMSVRSAATAALGILIWACGGDTPTRPTPTPTPTLTVTVTSLELTGPDTVAPDGGTAQFNATARMSDGSSRDITNEATWRTFNTGILTVSSTGLATGRQRGESGISISYGGRGATKSTIFVLPPGTFRLVGAVRDADAPVDGARVEVTLGTGQGLSTLSIGGQYRLYGVAGPIELAITKAGYEEVKQRFTVSTHQTSDVALKLTSPRADIAGTYTLELTAAPTCGTLPPEARVRRYTAVVTQNGAQATVTLSGADFSTREGRVRNTFTGQIEPAGVTFTMPTGYYYAFYGFYNPEVLERLSATMQVGFGGSAFGSFGGGTMSAAFNGVVAVFDNNFRRLTQCSSTSHQFVLTR
jgi:hypothetical protein